MCKECNEEKVRKVFLDDLPRWKGGTNKGKINWENVCDTDVKAIYNDEEYIIHIVGYDKKIKKLKCGWNDRELDMYIGSFTRCQFGNLLGKTGKTTPNFKIKIGQTFKDNKRDITITDRKYIKDSGNITKKYYKYKCNKCGFDCGEHYKKGEYQEEYLIVEGGLVKGNGCSVCNPTPQVVVPEINSIVANKETHWMIPYFQGGYDEAKMYTPQSNQYIYPVCPDCGEVRNKAVSICNIYKTHSIGCSCSNNVSFPEKVMGSVLKQLNIEFETQKIFSWSNRKMYDFYFQFNDDRYIIETHGEQHYNYTGFLKTLKEEQENDKYKKQLALKNGIKEENYIVIDCKKSDIAYIKENTLNSKLKVLFNLDIIDWEKTQEDSIKNICKEICYFKKNNPNMTTREISKMFSLNQQTIIRYLNKGNKISWVKYNPKEEIKNSGIKSGKMNGKKVEIFNQNNESLGIFSSCAELERESMDLFGIKLYVSSIAEVARGEREKYKNFIFRYVDETNT